VEEGSFSQWFIQFLQIKATRAGTSLLRSIVFEQSQFVNMFKPLGSFTRIEHTAKPGH
jgi:hypothetical protein